MALDLLVVDDVEAMRISLEAALVAAGHVVTLAANGQEALEKARQRRFDMVIADVWMPATNGLQLLRQLKTEQPGLRVIIISGGGPKLNLDTATSLAEFWGAERVFIKPFDENALIAAIDG